MAKQYSTPMLHIDSINDTDLITTSATNITGNGDVSLGGSGHGPVRTPSHPNSRIWD